MEMGFYALFYEDKRMTWQKKNKNSYYLWRWQRISYFLHWFQNFVQ